MQIVLAALIAEYFQYGSVRLSPSQLPKPSGSGIESSLPGTGTIDQEERWTPAGGTGDRGPVLQMAKESPNWGYDRIQSALANLGYSISDGTVGNILTERIEKARICVDESIEHKIFQSLLHCNTILL
jgi:hypothetical protein